MARISTHVLDVAKGRPAAGIVVELRYGAGQISQMTANTDGRTNAPLLEGETLTSGNYEIVFHAGDYFRAHDESGFYEKISIAFVVGDPRASYHVPLLLAPHGYSTYRGS